MSNNKEAAVESRPNPDASETAARSETSADSEDQLELKARAELLAEENRRLRDEYALARQASYQRTAFGLAVLGCIAALGGLVFSDGREVLFALAATGLFGGLLTYYLTPGQFVPANVGERVYAAGAANTAAIIDELGLRDERIYVPTDGSASTRLFVPQRAEYDIPDDLDRAFVTGDSHRGLVLEPTGVGLVREFERTLAADVASSAQPLAVQLSDGLVEGFELARSADPDVDPATGRATIAIGGSAFGPVDRFDHPIASFFAVGFAVGLERSVTLEVDDGGENERVEWLVTCRWDPGSETVPSL